MKEGVETMYSWVQDYSMEVQNHTLEDTYLFTLHDEPLQPNSSSNGSGSSGSGSSGNAVCYFPLHAKVELRKMKYDHSIPHDAMVQHQHQSPIMN